MDKSYYAVIPANVRYDNDLPANAKLLYGEITCLTNKDGYCWATNDYFADLYKVSKRSISEWIATLVKKGYISVQMKYVEGSKQVDKRYIKLGSNPQAENLYKYAKRIGEKVREKEEEPIEENFHTLVKKSSIPYRKNLPYPSEENFQDNTTSINNTSINNKKEIYKEKKTAYGEYQRVKLTDTQYQKLIEDFGEEMVKNQIQMLDEYVESNNNKNRYSNFNLVLRKSIRENWFVKEKNETPKPRKEVYTLDEMNVDDAIQKMREKGRKMRNGD